MHMIWGNRTISAMSACVSEQQIALLWSWFRRTTGDVHLVFRIFSFLCILIFIFYRTYSGPWYLKHLVFLNLAQLLSWCRSVFLFLFLPVHIHLALPQHNTLPQMADVLHDEKYMPSVLAPVGGVALLGISQEIDALRSKSCHLLYFNFNFLSNIFLSLSGLWIVRFFFHFSTRLLPVSPSVCPSFSLVLSVRLFFVIRMH